MPASQARYRPETRLVHAGTLRSQFGETSEALFLTQGYVYPTAEECEARFSGKIPGYVYSRYSNPTMSMFEQRMAALEGAEAARSTATGMAAVTTAIMGLVKAGDHVVAGLDQPHDRGGDGGHAGCGRARGLGAFERGHALLEHGHGRVGIARIDVARYLAG